jgi:Raf kinase inhibitor-like YbhB/YbcL family protein
MAFVLNSPAFADGDAIPKKHAQDGDNLSPPLEWRDPPPGTRSFVLMVEDADAPRNLARHWAVSDIPADCGRLAEGAGNAAKATLRHAVNDFGNLRYDGPAPLEGRKRHTYRFLLAALDIEHLDLPQSFAAAELWAAAQPHIIRAAEMLGTYERLTAPAARHASQKPSKGEPVVEAGDAGGPGAGRNITTADLDHDAGGPPPNALEPMAFSGGKPSEKKKDR